MRRFWQNLKRAAWYEPLRVTVFTLLTLFVVASLAQMVDGLIGSKLGGSYGYGVATGYLLFKFPTVSRWWRMRRYRRYKEKQARGDSFPHRGSGQ